MKEKFNVEYVDLETLLKNSDIITLHSPLTKDNFHLINDKAFKMMKKNSILINTARGELVNSKALYDALINKKLAGAGLDVLECEECLTSSTFIDGIERLNNQYLKNTLINNSILNLENVVVTPHIAYNTIQALHKILHTTIDNIIFFEKGFIKNCVYKILN